MLFLAALWWIGDNYFRGYQVEYGYHLTLFGPVEAFFLLLYALLGLGAAAVFSAALRERLAAVYDKLAGAELNPGRLVVVLCLAVFALTLMLRFLVVLEAPLTDDENAYMLGARIIAGGQLTLPGYPSELRPFLLNQFVVMGDSVFTQYFPGFMIVLALPAELGVEFLVNPILNALAILATYVLGRDISGSSRIGLCAALLLALSPEFLFTGATLLSHPLALAAGVGGLALVWRARRDNRPLPAILGAALIGVMLLTRPLTAVPVGAVGAAMLLTAPGPLATRLRVVISAAATGLAFVGLLLAYNYLVTGSPLQTPYAAFREFADYDKFAFDWGQLLSGRALELLVFPMLRFNFWLFGWPCSLFLLLFVPRGETRIFLGSAVLGIWLLHLTWPSVGVNLTGAAHYHEALPMLAVLSAVGLAHLIRQRSDTVRGLAVSAVFCSVVIALAIFYPWVARNLSRTAEANDLPYRVAESQAETPAVVFTGMLIHEKDRRGRAYNTWAYYRRNNRVDLDDPIVWLNDRGEENVVAMRHFPNRRYYRLLSALTEDGQSTYALKEIAPPPELSDRPAN
jgi:hypothetical protein